MTTPLNLDLLDAATRERAPRFIAIEGAIGVGKTSLARNLAQCLDAHTLFEEAELNPFLERFYREPSSAALATQLSFLFQRQEQIVNAKQNGIFDGYVVSDYLFEKDALFANITLNKDELVLYRRVQSTMPTVDIKPDLVIYLQAPSTTLLNRIEQRGINAEQRIDESYLNVLNESYMRFFHDYTRTPLLIVNVSEINPANNLAHFQELLDYILTIHTGRHYFNPKPGI